ncbi:Hypothetical predicted protein, partial [Pelobates cultripes]
GFLHTESKVLIIDLEHSTGEPSSFCCLFPTPIADSYEEEEEEEEDEEEEEEINK